MTNPTRRTPAKRGRSPARYGCRVRARPLRPNSRTHGASQPDSEGHRSKHADNLSTAFVQVRRTCLSEMLSACLPHNLSTSCPQHFRQVPANIPKRSELRLSTCPTRFPPEMLPNRTTFAVRRKCVKISDVHTYKGNVVLDMLTASKPATHPHGLGGLGAEAGVSR